MMGRVASHVAKELLNGQRVVLVRVEELNISGSLYRNKIIFERFVKKRMNTNPKRGPFHYRNPARMIWRTIRGMVPHKTPRGAAAMNRLKSFEGIPHPYDKQQRVVIPGALKNLRLRPHRKFCRLGDLAAQVGWTHNDLVARLEGQRKTRSAAFYNTKKEQAKIRTQAITNVTKDLADTNAALAKLGY